MKYAAEQEVRVAVVMYGGVSLCIYIHGVAQELLRLVRATATEDTSDGVVNLYRELSGMVRDVTRVGGAPKQTRFVVDLLAGTSAGGINAVFLAKALAVRAKNLDSLRATWVKVADMAKLLNGDADLLKAKTSLLKGQWMYEQLYDAFEKIDTETAKDAAEGYQGAKEIDLFVTTTDLNGVERPVRLADGEVGERVHKGVFHFRHDGAAAEKALEGKKDFEQWMNGMLAFAARCTSSFPIAFTPMRLKDIEPAVGKGKYGQWIERYREFLRWVPLGEDVIRPEDRPLADGGYLDNKPFGPLIEAMSYRASEVEQGRKLFYVDPFPEKQRSNAQRDHFDFVENTMMAAMTLPRYETIRGDLEAIEEANRTVEQLKGLEERVSPMVHEEGRSGEGKKRRAWHRDGLSTMVSKYGTGYATYHEIRVEETTEGLAEKLAAMAGTADVRSLRVAIGYVLKAWRKKRYAAEPEAGKETESKFLSQFDEGFRLRMAVHLLEEAKKRDANELCEELMQQITRLRRMKEALETRGARNPLYETATRAGITLTWERLREVLQQKAEADRTRVAEKLCQESLGEIDALAKELTELWSKIYNLNYRTTRLAMKQFEDLDGEYENFMVQDMLALTYLEGSEVRERAKVEVHRISPADGLQPQKGAKLAGYAVADFGAFLHEPWRENDILWGRLDAAGQLVRSLLPAEEDAGRRDDLLRRLQLEIVKQEAALRSESDPSRLRVMAAEAGSDVAGMLTNRYEVPEGPETGQLAKQLGIASSILGRMIEEDLGRPGRPATLLKTVGGTVVGLVAFLSPGTMLRALAQYWVALMATASVILAVLGIWVKDVQRIGWIGLGTSAALWILFQMLGAWLSARGVKSSPLLRVVQWVVVMVVLALLGLGASRAWELMGF